MALRKHFRRVSEWLAATLEMWCPERGCGFDSLALRLSNPFFRMASVDTSAGAVSVSGACRGRLLPKVLPANAPISPPYFVGHGIGIHRHVILHGGAQSRHGASAVARQPA